MKGTQDRRCRDLRRFHPEIPAGDSAMQSSPILPHCREESRHYTDHNCCWRQKQIGCDCYHRRRRKPRPTPPRQSPTGLGAHPSKRSELLSRTKGIATPPVPRMQCSTPASRRRSVPATPVRWLLCDVHHRQMRPPFFPTRITNTVEVPGSPRVIRILCMNTFIILNSWRAE